MRLRLLILFLASMFTTTALATTPGEVEVGSYLGMVQLHGLFGSKKTFADFKGKPLIINVWASWCGPCRKEMGSLQRLSQRYGGKQLNVIGVSVDDNGADAAAYIQKSKVTFENFLDRRLYLENMLGADVIPLTVLVDAEGRVVKKARGAFVWDSPELVDAIGRAFNIKLLH